jgi:hypothetical protein
MKIKHYIVTYNNNEILHKSLSSLISTIDKYDKDFYEIYIINNHSNFFIDPKFTSRIHVLHNVLRPDFSTGHLSRNWNQAIINGFVDLNNPACDILITSQNDCEFNDDFIPNLIELHKKYSFIQFGTGDHFVSYTPQSVKNVGLWDERFCNIGYQEADYFLRQMLYNTDNVSINDYRHKRIYNSETNNIVKLTTSGHDRGDLDHMESKKYHSVSEKIYNKKWGHTPVILDDFVWEYANMKDLTPLIESYMLYPYFEKDINIQALKTQNYLYEI